MTNIIETTTCDSCNMQFDSALGFEILWGGKTACLYCADNIDEEQD
jgi:hypothetical protein